MCAREESNMQEGSVIREHRKLGPDVWSYRWWESGPNGNGVHRRIVLGTAEQLRDLSSARQSAVTGHRKVVTFYGAHENLEGPVTEGTVLMEFLAWLTLRRHRRGVSFSSAHVPPSAPSALQSPACARAPASQAHRASASVASPR